MEIDNQKRPRAWIREEIGTPEEIATEEKRVFRTADTSLQIINSVTTINNPTKNGIEFSDARIERPIRVLSRDATVHDC